MTHLDSKIVTLIEFQEVYNEDQHALQNELLENFKMNINPTFIEAIGNIIDNGNETYTFSIQINY